LKDNKLIFAHISDDDPIKELIKQGFDMSLDVSGGWGYTQQNPLVLHSSDIPKKQLQHTLATMRTHLEMSLTQKYENRYGGINLNELSREYHLQGDKKYEKVTYSATAMKEEDYAKFINEYKNGYGKEDFNMQAHFEARKIATVTLKIEMWFLDQD